MRCGSGRRALTGGGGRAEPAVFGGWGARRFLVDILQRVWSQHTPIPPFSVKSLEVEMLERGIVCLVSGAMVSISVQAGERDSVSGERGSSSGFR